MKLDDLSFILGLFAADGNLDKSRVRFFCSEEELTFFTDFIAPKIESMFGIKPKIRFFNTHCYLLAINSTKIEKVFGEIFNYSGKKKYNLNLPSINFEDNSFISGLIAGDGSIVISKNNSEIYNYPMLKFTNSSKVLIDFFVKFLKIRGIGFYLYNYKSKGYFSLTIRGGKFKKLLNFIQILNPIQKSKLDVLEKVGYLQPKTSHKERIEILEAPVV